MGHTDDDVGAIVGSFAPDLGIVAVGADDGGQAGALGTRSGGAGPAGLGGFAGGPGVHLHVLVDDLTLVVDDDGGVAVLVAVNILEDRIEHAPNI